MDAFIDAYFAIDTEMSGEITSDELTNYMRANNYDEAFVQVLATQAKCIIDILLRCGRR